jgi:5-methylcytosine-specific restriction protein A
VPYSPKVYRPLGQPTPAQREQTWPSRRHPGRRWYFTARWKARRAQQLGEHPLCVVCLAESRTTPATDADHVIPHRWNEDLFWNGKLQSMCHAHHAAKTASEEGAWGR